MILLSFRKDFDNRLLFSAAPQWRIPPGESLKGRNCLFMVHGYENSAGAAEGNYANIERNLTDAGLLGPGKRYDQLVGVLWPGQTVLGFWLAERAADRAAFMLRYSITAARSQGFPLSISFVTHSLGARVALGCAVYDFWGDARGCWGVRDMVLLAPAVDDNSLDRGDRYAPATRRAIRTLVCYSERDEVLGVWFRRFSAFLNFNDVALGYNGPRDISKCLPGVITFDGTPYVDSHGAWMSCKEMYAAWSKLP